MYTILSEQSVFSWRIFDIVHQEVDVWWAHIKTFEKAVRSPWTRLIISDNNKILLTREYRIEIDNYDYRLPGGKVFDKLKQYNSFLSSGENILSIAQQAALKEAKEEVGIIQSDCNFFQISHNGSTVERDLYYFILSNCVFWEKSLGKWEYITDDWYSIDQVITMCMDGSMKEERSSMILLKFLYQKNIINFTAV